MSLNMDNLKKLHDAARANGVKSREFQQFQIKMYELFPTIYDIARKLTDSNTELQRDAERLDWLQSEGDINWSLDYSKAEISFELPEGLDSMPSLRAAIDLAVNETEVAE
jgi:hypothetical protein